jgi:hypothetical protein
MERQRRSTGTTEPIHASVPFDRIFTLLASTFGVAPVEREVAAVLTAARRPKLDHHRALLDLARGPDGRQRLITTNFDRLFQKAQRNLRTYTAPHLPDLSRAGGFDGVVHLHGILPSSSAKHSGDPQGLVLSSRDFGRAYLSEAWATRFFCNILDRYIVVLLGYSADDPPVRYLLEGLSASDRIREHRLFAFAAGEASEIEAEWRDRGVTVIAYNPVEGHRHLWEGIHAWACRARDPIAWRKQIAELAGTNPRQLKAFERGQVMALCSSEEGAEAFATAAPPPPAEWLCVLDATCRYWKPGSDLDWGKTTSTVIDPLDLYGLDDDPSRPPDNKDNQAALGINLFVPQKSDQPVAREAGFNTGQTNPLNRRLFQLARWLQSVMASPTAVWWAASRGTLHPELHTWLSRLLDQGAARLVPIVRQAWRLVLEARKYVPNGLPDGWYRLQSQIDIEGWTSRTLREFAVATRPRINAKRGWSRAPMPPDDSNQIRLSHIADFDVVYPRLIKKIDAVPDAKLAAVVGVIRHNLELGATLELEIGIFIRKLPTLHREDAQGERHYNDRDDYYLKFVSLYRRLLTFNGAAARLEYQQWNKCSHFFVALRIWGLSDPAITSAKEVGSVLRGLDDDIFWDSDYARELLWTIRARWGEISVHSRKVLESRLLRGRTKFDRETEAQYRERRATLSAERLLWMQEAGLQLRPSTAGRILTLKKANPHWQDTWAKSADHSFEGRSGFVKRDIDSAPIADLPLSEVIARCDELAKREFQSFTDHDPFSGLVKTSLRRAMAVLNYEASKGKYPRRYWSSLLSDWPETSTPRQVAMLAKAITSMPHSASIDVRYELARWLEGHFTSLNAFDRKSAYFCFDYVVGILEQGNADARKSGLGKTSVGGVEIPSNRMGVNYAINSPSGNLAQALICALSTGEPKANMKIPADLKLRIERLLKLPDEGGTHALTIVARELHGLYLMDRKWSRTVLLPRFNPVDEAAEAAWSGFLASAFMPRPALFRELKYHFINAIAASSRWNCQELTHLGEMLVLALEAPPRLRLQFSAAEARDALKKATPEIRGHTIFFLRSRIGQPKAWDRLIVPFFRTVWPRERVFQTSINTNSFILLLLGLKARFAQGVVLVADFLVPSTTVDTFVFQFSHDGDYGHADITTKFPREVLLVMSKIIDQTGPRAPYGLVEVLTRLVEAAPELRQDDRWQRLHRMTLL